MKGRGWIWIGNYFATRIGNEHFLKDGGIRFQPSKMNIFFLINFKGK